MWSYQEGGKGNIAISGGRERECCHIRREGKCCVPIAIATKCSTRSHYIVNRHRDDGFQVG